MKILNLYAGIGGNRKLWGDEHDVTAVENVPEIAAIYKDFFPGDKVIIGDAHQYLLDHFKEFDFIWSSPPCPTHSVLNYSLSGQGINRFPDMKLYEEIIFLKYWFKGKWVVENVRSYYTPLIKPWEVGRHYFWSNFIIAKKTDLEVDIGTFNRKASSLAQLKAKKNAKSQIKRNCVNPKLGLHVFNMAFKEKQVTL